MINQLQSIKEQLFDAPREVKESFNNLVEYFDNTEFYINKVLSDKGNEFYGYYIEEKRNIELYAGNGVTVKRGTKFTPAPFVVGEVFKGPFKNKKDADKELEKLKKRIKK